MSVSLSRIHAPRHTYLYHKNVRFLNYQSTVNFSGSGGHGAFHGVVGANRKLEVLELLQVVTCLDMRYELNA